ncbi:MAG: flavodoxin [Bacilli bacterium]
MAKSLVVYFSATGSTETVSQKIAVATSSDLFEIIPEVPYTKSDLDWSNPLSRTSKEKNDPSYRPEISSKVKKLDSYDTIYLGFPIYWYREPAIIDTFLTSYDFSGKKIYPFCTSGSSLMGNTPVLLQALVPNAKVGNGKGFLPSVKEEEIMEWLNGLKK